MRAAPADLGPLLASTHAVRPMVSAWRGGQLLAADVPVVDAQLTEAADQAVPERLTLTVPEVDPATGTTWRPTSPLAPLAPYGQRLRVAYAAVRADASAVTVPLGWFRIEAWELDGGAVQVEAAGLLAVLAQARLLAPTAPAAGVAYAAELRRLVEGLLPVEVTGPAARTVPAGFAWDEDRLGAVRELLAAWPARAHVDAHGVLRVLPPHDDAADPAEVELVEGDPQLGTVVEAATSGSRDGVVNVVVARGEALDDPTRPPVVGYAADTAAASASRYGGPYGPAPMFYASPLLTSSAQAAAAAATRLATAARRVARVGVASVPDPRISAADGTRVDVVRADGTRLRTRALAVNLPLTAGGGAASYTLGVLP